MPVHINASILERFRHRTEGGRQQYHTAIVSWPIGESQIHSTLEPSLLVCLSKAACTESETNFIWRNPAGISRGIVPPGVGACTTYLQNSSEFDLPEPT